MECGGECGWSAVGDVAVCKGDNGIMERRFECDFLGHAPLAARTRTGNDGSNVCAMYIYINIYCELPVVKYNM